MSKSGTPVCRPYERGRSVAPEGDENSSRKVPNVRVGSTAEPAGEKRRLLDFVLSNCSWKDGELTPTYRQPFDLLAVTVADARAQLGAESPESGRFEKWLPKQDGMRSALSSRFAER